MILPSQVSARAMVLRAMNELNSGSLGDDRATQGRFARSSVRIAPVRWGLHHLHLHQARHGLGRVQSSARSPRPAPSRLAGLGRHRIGINSA